MASDDGYHSRPMMVQLGRSVTRRISPEAVQAAGRKARSLLYAPKNLGFTTHLSGMPLSLRLSRSLSKEALMAVPLTAFVLIFLTCNAICVAAFAALFYACDSDCYDIAPNDFSFAQMLWLSIHTFTTVGYGSHSPTGDCIVPQLLVFMEHFVGLLDVAIFTSMLLSKSMHPNPKALVMFSEKFIISDEDDGHRWLTLRIVRTCKQNLRNCELHVMCGVAELDRNGVMSCSEKPLRVQTSRKNVLETWFVRHQIDESSPLHQSRFKKLAFLNVTLDVFDTAYMEGTKIFHSYVPSRDLVRNARFVDMKSWQVVHAEDMNSEVQIREMHHHIDLSKLNDFVAYDRGPLKSCRTVFKTAMLRESSGDGDADGGAGAGSSHDSSAPEESTNPASKAAETAAKAAETAAKAAETAAKEMADVATGVAGKASSIMSSAMATGAQVLGGSRLSSRERPSNEIEPTPTSSPVNQRSAKPS
mmetsp:Transcript_27924/g.71353  ORF Transcript_27924/g.71353 Transcript_27924/m.71353 type:complete len:473 (-) Transcript_27924:227-1645(-)|eukprot:CAMPEP_0115859446 /NCGR_PEP_ID=MMETSP0287-20121206/16619_1 /TAXON_ID=412157 /ORGANISM="Chrysochromulina rotalis, Strain UIO044" /LENGTH=472 /DNA_ID=CAMNT_0003313745 /DNA_START=57 /DNA_END=1475 /DNA_ORIENTATION=-